MLEKIASENFWYKDQETGIRREAINKIMPYVDINDNVLIITGIRRSGKTYLTKQILKEKIDKGLKLEQTMYINFENEEIVPFINKDIIRDIYNEYRRDINPKDYAIFVLDEIQNVPEWERTLRSFIDKHENVKFIVTGSGSKIFHSKLSYLLTGRRITFTLYPLSFSEFLKFKNIDIVKYGNYLNELEEYLKYGSFPLIVLMEIPEQKILWLKQTYEDIITRDIMLKFRLRDELILKKVAYLVLNSFSGYISIRKIVNSMKTIMKVSISPSTVSYYFDYFSQSYLFYFLPIFSYNIKDQEQYPKKLYCVDSGIINAVLFTISENKGRLMENVVAIELLRRKTLANFELFYWRNYGKHDYEVDFVVKEGLKVKQLIQVTYASSREEINKRELRSLLKASRELKCNDLLVITWDYENEEEADGKRIRFIPLWKWLL